MEGIECAALSHFMGLFATMNPKNIEQAMQTKVIKAMNVELIRLFDPGEVKTTLFQIIREKLIGQME